jgi:hypothetical protein
VVDDSVIGCCIRIAALAVERDRFATGLARLLDGIEIGYLGRQGNS